MTALGDADGEVPDVALVRFSGAAQVDRALLLGERVAFTLVGEVRRIGFQTRDGVLTRVHAVGVETVAEPGGRLLTDITELLAAVDDAREGRDQLPFDDGEDE